MIRRELRVGCYVLMSRSVAPSGIRFLSQRNGCDMRLYDLFEIAWPGEDDLANDPIHRTADLWRGIDIAERFLGFSLEDLGLLFRHSRPATVSILFRVGAELGD